MEKIKKNYFEYAKELITLSLPIIMGHIGFTLIMAGDIFVAGRYSTDVLAAVSISGAITSIIFMFGIGLISSVSPVLSNRLGGNQSVKKYFYSTIGFAMKLAVITTALIILSIPVICNMGFEEKLLADIKIYTFVFAFSAFGGYLHAAIKEFLQAYEIVFFPNFIAIVGVFLNLVLNWAFVFGWGVIPSMGALGLAIASVIVRTIMGLILLVFCLMKFTIKFQKVNSKSYVNTLMKVGLPISFAICLEFIMFNSISILMGRVSGNYVAAQSIINVIASLSFMIPLSISTAIAVKVGFANGAKNFDDIKKYILVGCGLSAGFMAMCGILFATFPAEIAGLFTKDMTLINIIVPIMYIVACFQISDGLQTSLGGAFKGLKKTTLVVILNFCCYICVGLSAGIYFAFNKHMNLLGFWLGVFIGSGLLAITLGIALVSYYKKIKRVATNS